MTNEDRMAELRAGNKWRSDVIKRFHDALVVDGLHPPHTVGPMMTDPQAPSAEDARYGQLSKEQIEAIKQRAETSDGGFFGKLVPRTKERDE